MTAHRKRAARRAATLALGGIAGLAATGAAASAGPPASAAHSGPSASALAPIHGHYAPKIEPANFVRSVDNRYFPLEPGTAFHYEGVAENGTTRQTDVMTVTHRTRMILGVRATVVRDVVSTHGRPIEKTYDWYAQDKGGNVWYMGESTRELRHGRFVRASDSWEAGSGGAKPGIIMPGHPRRGDRYRQEYYPGHALDRARVLGRGGRVTVPYGSFRKTLLTDETAPKLDPGVHEHKYYVAGVGDVLEHTVAGNHEEIGLVRVTHECRG